MKTSSATTTIRRTQEGPYTISTIVDNGIIETAVFKTPNKTVIVNQYPTREAAIADHDRWVQYCKDHAPRNVFDVNQRRRTPL